MLTWPPGRCRIGGYRPGFRCRPMLLLYDVPLSPFAQKVKMALVEKGLDYDTRIPTLGAPDADFAAAIPRHEVPPPLTVLSASFDSPVIVGTLICTRLLCGNGVSVGVGFGVSTVLLKK